MYSSHDVQGFKRHYIVHKIFYVESYRPVRFLCVSNDIQGEEAPNVDFGSLRYNDIDLF